MHVAVHGLAIAGAAAVRALQGRGHTVTVTDDTIDDARRELAADLGVEVSPLPAGDAELDAHLAGVDAVLPAPGVPESHPLFAAARRADVEIVTEIELAYRWEQERPGGPRPILAITGTDGKTTTTDLTVAILRAAGLRADSLGNTDIPLIEAVESDLDALVVECTSFRLAFTRDFRADAAVWLNLAPDHLNWHDGLDTYIAAKRRIFDLQRPDDAAIGFVTDEVVMDALAQAPGRRLTFGLADADYRLDGEVLVGPSGPICRRDQLWRSLPHDVTNALAASALVLETGLAGPDAIAAGVAAFRPQPHRLELVGEADRIAWYNDSKATTPHAAATAIRGFDSLVLIAGGSRKGVDLAPMAAEPHRVRAVVALGDAAPDVAAAFAPTGVPLIDAADMSDAVTLAARHARAGDAVVLSPGCASFDAYSGYGERGDHFRRLVAAHLAERARHEPARHEPAQHEPAQHEPAQHEPAQPSQQEADR